MVVITRSEAETELEGEKLGKIATPGSIIALCGGLGAGKTTFAKGLAIGLGINANVTSPTFTIVNEYYGKKRMIHFELYRIETEDELYEIGWDEYSASDGVCVVEWSEKILHLLPKDTIIVKLEIVDNNQRRIIIKNEVQL